LIQHSTLLTEDPIAADVIRLLLSIFRDPSIDCSLKLAAVEATIRLVNSHKVDCPQEFIAALILQYFERPEIKEF
jgi:hypothetical protein